MIRVNKLLVGAVDLVLYMGSFFLAFYLKFGPSLPEYNLHDLMAMLPWFAVTFIVLAAVYNIYSRYEKYDDIVLSLICIVFLSLMINIALSFAFRQFAIPRTIFAISAALQMVLLAAWRRLVWLQGWLVGPKLNGAIIGYPAEIKEVLGSINQALGKALEVTYIIKLNGKDNFDYAWARFLSSQTEREEISAVIICAGVGEQEKDVILDYCIRTNKLTMMVPTPRDILLQRSRLVSAGDVPLIQMGGIVGRAGPDLVKRSCDIALSAASLIILAPIILLISVIIKMDSPGPVFYSQARVGLNGKVFRVHKFRTMRQDAEKNTGPVLSGEDDPRVTRVGRFLRKTRLDEIPQLWNVLVGDMSMVGPRPERPYFVEQYTRELPQFEYRHKIECGLTGLAQVEGKYSTQPGDKLCYDLIYAQNRSTLLDLIIILRTVKVLLQKGKAS